MDKPQYAKKEDIQKFPDELTVTKEDGTLIASISLLEGNAIVADGYKVVGYEED